MKKINDENLTNGDVEEGLEKPNFFKILGKTFFIPILAGGLFFSGYSIHEYYKERNYKETEVNQWVNMGIDNCVIDKKNSIEGNDVYKIMLQSNIYDRKQNRALFFDSNGKQYEARIDVDALDGLSYVTTLDNKNRVWVTFDYNKRTCNVTAFTDNVETLFDKKGYMGFSTDFNSLGDWEFAKEMDNLDKKTHKKK